MKAIFVELEENPKLADQIASAAHVKVVTDLLDHSLTSAERAGSDLHRHDEVRHARDRREPEVRPQMTPVAHGLGFELRDVDVNYDGHVALERVSLSVSAGAQVAVVGPNGAGKSTLFKALAGLLPLRSGRIDLRGRAAAAATSPTCPSARRSTGVSRSPRSTWC